MLLASCTTCQTRQTYDGPVVMGEDLMSFEIGDTVTVRKFKPFRRHRKARCASLSNRDFRSGSKCEKLGLSRTSPLVPLIVDIRDLAQLPQSVPARGP